MNIEYFGKISPELLYEITLKDVYKFTSTGLLASPLTRKSTMYSKFDDTALFLVSVVCSTTQERPTGVNLAYSDRKILKKFP